MAALEYLDLKIFSANLEPLNESDPSTYVELEWLPGVACYYRIVKRTLCRSRDNAHQGEDRGEARVGRWRTQLHCSSGHPCCGDQYQVVAHHLLDQVDCDSLQAWYSGLCQDPGLHHSQHWSYPGVHARQQDCSPHWTTSTQWNNSLACLHSST